MGQWHPHDRFPMINTTHRVVYSDANFCKMCECGLCQVAFTATLLSSSENTTKTHKIKRLNPFQLYILTWDFCFLLNIGCLSFTIKALFARYINLYSIKQIGEMPLLNKIKSLLPMGWRQFYLSLNDLTYWDRNKTAAILQTSIF